MDVKTLFSLKRLASLVALLLLPGYQTAFGLEVDDCKTVWGPPSNWLRMSIAIVSDDRGEQMLQWTIKNTNPKQDFYLPAGGGVGCGRAYNVQLILTLPDGSEQTAVYLDRRPWFGRPPVALVLPLLSNSSYTAMAPLRYWTFGAPDFLSVEDSLFRPSLFRMQLVIQEYEDKTLYDGYYDMRFFWRGTLTSNILISPLR